MTYSTGAGDYNALMAAVLAHAVTDGWTTSGGNWPISKGNVRGVDWWTWTQAATDYLSGAGIDFTERIINIAVGTSLANATDNASSSTTSVQVRGMNFAITEWHIFSDPANYNYIHVVTRSSNGYDADTFQHFSFGQIDKGGMTYGSVAYAASSNRRPYVAKIPSSATEAYQSYDWNCGVNSNYPTHFSGRVPIPSAYDRIGTRNNLVYIISPTASPVPGSGGWPQPDILQKQSSVFDTNSADRTPVSSVGDVALNSTQYSPGMNFMVSVANAHPYSGGVSLAPLPFIITNGHVSTSLAMFLGMFPGVRVCSMRTFAQGNEITYAADTWKLLPLLKQTDFSNMQKGSVVSSGETGYAYKKVA